MKNKNWFGWVIGFCGIISMALICLFLFVYFKNVNIVEWLYFANYTDKGEYYKQIGLFIATLSGFYFVISRFGRLLDYFPTKKKEK